MDKTSLVEPDIEAGKHLLSALERAGLAISIAAWLKLEDSVDWRLFIASPDVQKHGPLTVNKFIDKVISAIDSNIHLHDVAATNTTNHFINKVPLDLFASSIHSKAGVYRLRDWHPEDADVEEGLFYKVDRNVKSSREAPRPDAEALKRARKLAA